MPETRTYDPEDGSGLGKLVRDALGESARPFEAGDASKMRPEEELDAELEAEEEEREEDAQYNAFASALPTWDDFDEDEDRDN